MMDDTPVDMDAPMTVEEWAIWSALWNIPEVRRHYRVHHDGPLTCPELAHYLGLSDKAVWELQDKALVKLRVALNRYILQQEINRQQHFDNQ